MKHLNQITLGFVLTFVLAAAARGDGFIPTGRMNDPRWNHTATRLFDGRVLVVAGSDADSGPLATAELYDPATGTWTNTSSLASPREYHTATLLPNGKVLVYGGFDVTAYGPFGVAPAIYDPASGTWAPDGIGIQDGIAHHTATLLPNGKVLIAGGVGNHFGPYKDALLYDSASNSWSATGSLGTPRMDHTATLLPNGKVLVQGGGTNSAELYNPTNGTWTTTGSPLFQGDTATLLPNGKVLVVGVAPDGFGNYSPSAELYNPATGTWSATGSPAHGGNSSTLLFNGKVLLTEKVASLYGPYLSNAELYDPATGTWSPADNPNIGIATLLLNGKVLVAGFGAELYESSLNPIINPITLGDGSIQFSFSNLSGTGYRVLASTDAAAPLNTWSNLGPATETPPGSGQFQFTDHQAMNYPQRFYRVSSP